MDSITGYYGQGQSSQWLEEDSHEAKQIISGEGELKEKDLEDFMKRHECGVSYAIVAIMGPQSSGKSTLLNHLFHTSFKMMDAFIGRKKETDGIWIEKAPNMDDPCIMVMDVEGTDGQEKGQDGTTFEKRSALFALVVADIFFINIRYHDIGLENAACRPLLKTIFEVMQIIPSRRRKATLHFIMRDMENVTPVEVLQTTLRNDVQKIWEIVPKTEHFKDTPLSEIFDVEVDALSNYRHEQEKFNEEVIQLRNRILNSIRVAGDDRGDVIPTSGFSLQVKKLWETIRENKQLDLPTQKEMVAKVRSCVEIARLAPRINRSLDDCIFKLKDKEGGFSWAHIRSFLKNESDSAASAFCSGIASFELDQAKLEQIVHDLKQHARELVVDKFKMEAEYVLPYMLERYILSLARREENPFPKCLRVLSAMAVIRLDESPSDDDEVEKVLFSALIDGDEAVSLDSDTWEEVSPEMTLIAPARCKDIWEHFQQDIQIKIGQTQAAAERQRGNYQTSANSETFELCGNSETPESQFETTQLPHWVRVGTWLLGVGNFVRLIWMHRELTSAIPLFSQLAVDGIELFGRYAKTAEKAYGGIETAFGQMMTKLEEALEKFYNFMMGIFTRKSEVGVIS